MKVRKLREEHGYSQMDIASFLGISNGQVGNIESLNSPHKYTLEQLYRICKLFNLPIEQIFIEDNEYSEIRDFVDLLITKILKYGKQ